MSVEAKYRPGRQHGAAPKPPLEKKEKRKRQAFWRDGTKVDESIKRARTQRLNKMMYEDQPPKIIRNIPVLRDLAAPISKALDVIDDNVPKEVKFLAEELMFAAIPHSRVLWTGINALF